MIIVITGTPGTGKTTLSSIISKKLDNSYRHIEVAELVKTRNLYSKFDEEWQSYIVDDDKVVDALAEEAASGNCIIDTHDVCLVPDNVDLIVVLRTDHTLLWDRLKQRSYSDRKIQENNDAEIMNVVLEEATQVGQDLEIEVIERQNDTVDDQNENIKWLLERLK